MSRDRRHFALFISGFETGGVPRIMTTLAQALANRGHWVDLVVACAEGPARKTLSSRVRLVNLADWRILPPLSGSTQRMVMTSIPALARYLRSERPDVLLSGGNYPNFTAVMGRVFARVRIPVIVSHHSHLSLEARNKPFVRWIARHIYPKADAIIAVSRGVAEELTHAAHIPTHHITTIYNPATSPDIQVKACEPIDHPWFAPGEPPVVLGAGRLHKQKDFPTLVRAFAHIREVRKARLVILGVEKKPERRTELVTLASRIGIVDDVALPGYVDNPFAYMARASVFVLSSAWEGLPTALIEAMACGCPVISTNCPSGPFEIMEGGKYGPLVSVGDDEALAKAVLSVFDSPPDPGRLRARAADFSVDVAVDRYLEILLGQRLPARLSG